ncbi:unnamed protein product [Leuciscus chuanchicus]
MAIITPSNLRSHSRESGMKMSNTSPKRSSTTSGLSLLFDFPILSRPPPDSLCGPAWS